MFVIALIGDADPPVQGADTDPAVALKGVIPLIGVLHGWGTVRGRLVQTLKAFLGDLRTTMFHILLELRPQSFVGSRNLPFHATGQLGGEMIASTQFCIHAFVQSGDIAGFAMSEGIMTHRVERITIGQLRLA